MMVICGLGNPGEQYQNTRHNVGFLFVEHLAREMGISLSQARHGGAFARGTWKSADLVLFQPMSYMNLSGRPVAELMRFFKLATHELVCVFDDLDQDPLAVRVRKGGGHGGNNGVRDILACLGDDGFHRIKIGIGKPEHRSATKDWVLGKFTAEQLESLEMDVFPIVKDRLINIMKQNAKL